MMNMDENMLKQQADAINGMSDEQLRMMAQNQGRQCLNRIERGSKHPSYVCWHDEEYVTRPTQKYDRNGKENVPKRKITAEYGWRWLPRSKTCFVLSTNSR